jgi:hypothetical protein
MTAGAATMFAGEALVRASPAFVFLVLFGLPIHRASLHLGKTDSAMATELLQIGLLA